MVTLLLTIQAQPGASASSLGLLNTLGIAVFLMGIGLLLLLSTHYYRMRDAVEKRRKHGGRRYRFGDSADILQLQYMSREELKEMILRERQERLKREAAMKAQRDYDKDALLQGVSEPESSDEPRPTVESDGGTVPPKTPSPEAELLARMVIPAEKEPEEEKVPKREPPKHPYHDKIQRSLSSHESLEEFRKKSRKV